MSIVIGLGVGGQNLPDEDYPDKPYKMAEPSAQYDFYSSKSKWYPTWGASSVLQIDYITVYAL